MRCFTFKNGLVTPGIQTSQSKTGKTLIFLGSKGVGCACSLVFFDHNPSLKPDVDKDGMVNLAYPIKRNFDQKEGRMVERVILKKAYPSPTKILLRVNTSTPSTDKINGRWKKMNGRPEHWVKSHGFSIGQRWADDLVTMDDQDDILIIPAGGGRDDRVVIMNIKGTLSYVSEYDYQEVKRKRHLLIAKAKADEKTLWETSDDEEVDISANSEEVNDNLETKTNNNDVDSSNLGDVNPEKAIEGKAQETVIHSEQDAEDVPVGAK